MSLLRKTFAHTSIYTISQVLGLFVSLISFPILTRILSTDEYGDLALVNVTITMLLGITKCGIPSSFIREHSKYTDNSDERIIYTSAFALNIINSLLVISLYSLILILIKPHLSDQLTILLYVGGLIVFSRNYKALFSGFYRVQEKIIALSIISLLIRIGTFASGIGLFYFLLNGLYSYLIGVLIFETISMLVLMFIIFRQRVLKFNSISLTAIRSLYAFGIPLLFTEVAFLLNDYSDRFLIKYFLDSSSLGIYSVAYNLSSYVKQLLTASIWMTIFPIYTKLWESDGYEKTTQFLTQILKYYICIALFSMIIVSSISRDLIVLLATDKYTSAADLLPFLLFTMLLYGVTNITGAGIYLHKKIIRLSIFCIYAASINFIINLLLIPKYGISGAVYATVISYIFLTIIITIYSNKLFRVFWPIKSIGIFCASAFFTLIAIIPIDFNDIVLNILSKLFIGTLVYWSIILLMEHDIRNASYKILKDVKAIISSK